MPDHLRREPCLTALKSFTKCRKLIVCVLHLFFIHRSSISSGNDKSKAEPEGRRIELRENSRSRRSGERIVVTKMYTRFIETERGGSAA